MRLIANGQDISQFYTSCKWSGAKGEAARKLEFGVVVSGTDKNLPKLQIPPESEVLLFTDDGDLLFKGLVVSREKSVQGNTMDVTCVDSLYYLNRSKGSFSFADKTPQAIAGEVFGKFGLTTGSLAPGSPLTRTFDMESLYSIILIAYKLENEKTGKPYMIRMKGDQAEVVEQGKIVAQYELDPKATLIDAQYGDNAENLITKVKVFDTDGKEVGEIEKKIELLEGGGKKETSEESTSGQGQAPKDLTGGSNKEKVWNYLKGQGFSDAAAAGVMGNLMQESSTEINPKLKQPGGPGRGIAQWTVGSDRWNALQKYAQAQGKSWESLDVQLGFMVKEMDSKATYWKKTGAGSLEGFKKMTNTDQAVMAFEQAYERAGRPVYANRKKYAKEVISSFGGQVGATTVYRQEKDEDKDARAKAQLTEIEKSAHVRVFGNTDLITGNAVIVKEPFTGLNGKFFIDGDTHTWEDNKYMVELDLNFKNIMTDVDTADQEKSTDEAGGTAPAGDGSLRAKALQTGVKLGGTHYQWGGNTPQSGLDCTGFVDWCYTQAGMPIPGRLQSHALRANPAQFNLVEIPWNERQPGDILWQNGHCAMQYYNGQILESGGTSKQKLGYSGVAITSGNGRRFCKAYRYKGT